MCAQAQSTTQVQRVTIQMQGGAIFVGNAPVSQPSPETSPVDPEKVASISGTVFSAANGSPLRKARITLQLPARNSGLPIARGALTDESGHFSIESLSPGQYDLSVQHDGYVQQQYGQDKPGKPPEMLTLAAGQKMDDLTFRLQQSAVITGHVYDEDGDPIENANVEVVRMAHIRGKRQLEGEHSGSTDDQGEYRIYDLNPGHYYIRASHGGSGFMGTLGEEDLVYPPVFYPNAISFDKASPIDLKPGDEIPGVDFQLTPNPSKGYEVAGRVVGGATVKAGSMPGPMAMVTIAEKTADSDVVGMGSNARQVMANPTDGTFRFSNIAPGTYRVRELSRPIMDSPRLRCRM